MKLNLFVLIMCVACLTGRGATYYVATNGNDSATGTESEPLLTIQAAVDKTTTGDTVQLTAGTYSLASVVSVSKAIAVKGEIEDRRAVARFFLLARSNACIY